ncbi:MAG TPA: glucan biosynthesis protein D [Alphaproteobacteria bacterium]
MPLLATFAGRVARAETATGLRFGPPQPFSFERLKDEAKRLAGTPFVAPPPRAADVLDKLDYDDHNTIRFNAGRALWAEGGGPFPIQFFHLGKWFKSPVSIYAVEGGEAREVLYAPDFFTFTRERWDEKLPRDIGFAGFRVMAPPPQTDWLAFLGAAYFRSSGALDQYGLSARGVAIDTAMPTPEEFPRFTKFWLAPVAGVPNAIAIHALMDGPSVAGAFRMLAAKAGNVVMDIECALYARKDIARMGVAPLTSMFWYGKSSRPLAADWRPQIHDSDGLSLWTGLGERIWRPLNNPPTVRTSSFLDKDPKGFGLLQRDRNFENYQDDGVFYNKRPSVWVEPVGDWGEGAVQLVEIPTDDEIHDNIVAYWVPKAAVTRGSQWSFRYRLHWVGEEPFAPPVGRVVATWTGMGGRPGQPRPKNKRKIVIDFEGGPIADLPEKARETVEVVVTPAGGTVDNVYSHRVVGTKRWRAFVDVAAAGREPVDLRLFLRQGGRPLTETWLWQYIPRD